MRTYRDEGLVLRTHKLGEADRIITVLTRYNGLVRAVAKGVRRTSSRFGARLEPFGVIDAQFHRGRSLDILTQVETIAPYGRRICSDYQLYTTATVMVEAAEKLNGEELESPQQYLLLAGALNALSLQRYQPNLILGSYLLRALALAGWAPSCYSCAVCGQEGLQRAFSVNNGGAVCEDCCPAGTPQAREGTLELMGALLSGDWEQAMISSPSCRDQASALIAAYTQWHLERHLKSLAILERGA